MGLKGLQITGNSIMPMLTYFGNPLVEHFPTHAEQFNQNVNGLSWGSANLAWQSVELFTQYTAVALIFAVQSLDLRAIRQLRPLRWPDPDWASTSFRSTKRCTRRWTSRAERRRR